MADEILTVLNTILYGAGESRNTQKIMDDVDIEAPKTGSDNRIAPDLLALFNGEMNPVAPKAQRKVPIPEGLVLIVFKNGFGV